VWSKGYHQYYAGDNNKTLTAWENAIITVLRRNIKLMMRKSIIFGGEK
jgi:hypothetical protein